MHRHGYKGRKFGRVSAQRDELIRGLAKSLIEYQSIETTLPKAKELRPYVEKLITKAKKGDLHNRRQVIDSLHSDYIAHILVDDIAPKLTARNSGYLRIEKTGLRRGDNSPMARISFVDDLSKDVKSEPKKTKKATPAKKTETAKKPVSKPKASSKKETK